MLIVFCQASDTDWLLIISMLDCRPGAAHSDRNVNECPACGGLVSFALSGVLAVPAVVSIVLHVLSMLQHGVSVTQTPVPATTQNTKMGPSE